MRDVLPPLLLLVTVTACDPGTIRRAGLDDDTADTAVDPVSDSDSDEDTGADTGSGPNDTGSEQIDTDTDTGPVDTDTGPVETGVCPAHMVLVDDAFCVDAYEAALEERAANGTWSLASPYETVGARTVRAVSAPGLVPQGYLSGDEAESACEASGKRLCTSDEWLSACRGPSNTTFPYGNAHQAGACNDDYAGHPVVDYFGTSQGIWDTTHMNHPGINQQAGTVAEGGAFSACVSAWGAYDLHGNLHEWVDDADGTFRGGFYADASINGAGCTYRTGAHARGYHDYSTGFRCCADP